MRREAQARDLAGARADDEMQPRLIIEDQALEMHAHVRIVFEGCKLRLLEHHAHHQRNTLAGRLDALTHRVVREKTAQDDPEQPHRAHSTARFPPGGFSGATSYKFSGQGFENAREVIWVSYGFEYVVSHIWRGDHAARTARLTASGLDSITRRRV